jgi:hypothetical protein
MLYSRRNSVYCARRPGRMIKHRARQRQLYVEDLRSLIASHPFESAVGFQPGDVLASNRRSPIWRERDKKPPDRIFLSACTTIELTTGTLTPFAFGSNESAKETSCLFTIGAAFHGGCRKIEFYGNDVPALDFTSAISAAVIVPLIFTSVRKLDAFAV